MEAFISRIGFGDIIHKLQCISLQNEYPKGTALLISRARLSSLGVKSVCTQRLLLTLMERTHGLRQAARDREADMLAPSSGGQEFHEVVGFTQLPLSVCVCVCVSTPASPLVRASHGSGILLQRGFWNPGGCVYVMLHGTFVGVTWNRPHRD